MGKEFFKYRIETLPEGKENWISVLKSERICKKTECS
jgi:hypothetical protein